VCKGACILDLCLDAARATAGWIRGAVNLAPPVPVGEDGAGVVNWAICAIVPVINPGPFPESIDITVVGFVLAAPDRKVRKSEIWEDEE